MIEILRKAGYPSDPVKAWKESISTPEERSSEREDGEEEEEGREDVAEKVGKGQPDYNYLLGMQLWSLTKEKKDEMIQNRDKKVYVCVCCVTYKCFCLFCMYVSVWGVYIYVIVWQKRNLCNVCVCSWF